MISCQVIGWCITIRAFVCTWVSNTFLRNTNNSLLLDYNRRVCGNFLLMYFLNKVYYDYRYWSRFIFQRPQKHKGQRLLNVECQSHYLSISDHNTESQVRGDTQIYIDTLQQLKCCIILENIFPPEMEISKRQNKCDFKYIMQGVFCDCYPPTKFKHGKNQVR